MVKVIVIALLIAIVLGGGSYLVFHKTKAPVSPPTTSTPTTQTTTTPAPTTTTPTTTQPSTSAPAPSYSY